MSEEEVKWTDCQIVSHYEAQLIKHIMSRLEWMKKEDIYPFGRRGIDPEVKEALLKTLEEFTKVSALTKRVCGEP